ncbi:COPII coat GTPase [Datura stramonium]|uniref:COPII coat GTPase n=1 Tax=Datura stramonium TaxID=4076 RepID=A0ABS8WHE1_DATST|nr:COPII coat GTPase [Datura stramonium]
MQIGAASTHTTLTSEELSIGKIKFKAFDLGGHQITEESGETTMPRERFPESKKELDGLMSDESLTNVPFLILGNKIDMSYAASEDELHYHLGLTSVTHRQQG